LNSSAICRRRRPGSCSGTSCAGSPPNSPPESSRLEKNAGTETMTQKPKLFVKPPEDDELPRTLQPMGWPRPLGYANGMTAKGRVVVTGGVVGWDVMGNFPDTFAAQARQTFSNILKILAEGGAGPEHLVRLTWYVTDLDEYRASGKDLG